MNIVKNAVEAIEEKYKNSDSIASGHVGAALEIGPGGEVVIHVTDDGIGLPEARDAIAEPYMTTRQGGTGLGLAIVKKIVEQHYGELEFSDNTAGQGTRRSEKQTSELQSLMRISYAVFCLKKK